MTTLYNQSSSKERYRTYLQSNHWYEIKEKYKNSKLPQNCYICSTYNLINLHHRTYKRRGKEYLRDLLPLCWKCHRLAHEYLKRSKSTRINLWNIARKLKSKLGLRKRKVRSLD